jgi:thiaminase/transcriptional activator TenA
MAQSFWDAASPLISVTERHPFLVSMVDGTLNHDSFQYYTIQDALYLSDFATCLRMLGDKMLAETNDGVKSNRLHHFAMSAEEDEKELHRNFFKR